jgi:hypothetical protein
MAIAWKEDMASLRHDELQKAFALSEFNLSDIFCHNIFMNAMGNGAAQRVWNYFGVLKYNILVEEPLDDGFNVPDLLIYFTHEGKDKDEAEAGVIAVELKTDLAGQFGGTMRKLKKYARGRWKGRTVEGVILIADKFNDTRKLFCQEGFLTISATVMAGLLYSEKWYGISSKNPLKNAFNDKFSSSSRGVIIEDESFIVTGLLYDLEYCAHAINHRLRDDGIW